MKTPNIPEKRNSTQTVRQFKDNRDSFCVKLKIGKYWNNTIQ